MKYKNIYVAASSQHVGKTTSTLGLVSAYTLKGLDVGYCKPVGQQFLDVQEGRVDKDTILFSDLIDFEIDPAIHSPIIMGKGATKDILDGKSGSSFEDRLLNAKRVLNNVHDLVIFEGTGHPGVGSVAEMSNAQVAKKLEAGVIMIVEGGIGSTIDMLNMTLSLFREQEVPLIGVILNKVRVDKLDIVKHYVKLWLDNQGIPLLGVLPYDNSLAYPLVSTVAKAIKGTIKDNAENLDQPVMDILAGSLVDIKELKSFENLLLVSSTRMVDRAVRKIVSFSRLKGIKHSPICGIILTGDGEVGVRCQDYIDKFKIPVIHTNLDTYGVTLKISRIEVKINRRTPDKVKKAIELIRENVDLQGILTLNK